LESFRKNKFLLLFFLYLLPITPYSLLITLKADAHIFVYHRFEDFRYPSTNTSIKELKKEFDYLKDNGYEVITLRRLVEAIKTKEKIPDNWVVLTIDDGYKSFYENALKLFKEYKYPFTLFVSTKPSEQGFQDFMNWKEINECSLYGEIGLHSHSHPHLTHLSDEEIKKDTKTAIRIFKKRLGFFPKYYAYPYGEYDERVKNIIKNFGFDAICNQNMGAIEEKSDIYNLDRIALVGKVNFAEKLKIKYLNAIWFEPKIYPKDSILKKVKIKIFEDVTKAELYITDLGWRWVRVKDGIIEEDLNVKLKKSRVRVIIKVKNSKINTKILVK